MVDEETLRSWMRRLDEEGERALSGWQPLWVEADSLAPFALARSLGAGQLVVVADARIVSNARLA